MSAPRTHLVYHVGIGLENQSDCCHILEYESWMADRKAGHSCVQTSCRGAVQRSQPGLGYPNLGCGNSCCGHHVPVCEHTGEVHVDRHYASGAAHSDGY